MNCFDYNLNAQANETDDTIIKIEDVQKQYRLGLIGGGTLQGDLQSWWARLRGKEDPNMKIGAKVYKKNEKFLALDGINLEVKKGERVGIIGHNGAGKSTLLKLLSRVTAPTTGKIYLDGRISSMLEVGTGFHGELTGRENIYLNGAILGMTREEVTAKIDKIIEFSECGQFIDTPVKRYSSGMYVKLAFSVAAHLDSEILIMDEVLAVGDMAFQQKCIDKMSEVSHSEGRTILYVSHNMATIRKLCDRCVVLDHGKVVFDGDVERAIEIYINESGNTDSNYKYDNYPRSPKEPRTLQFMSMNFNRKADNVWNKNEKVKAKLKCRANGDCKDVRLRFETRSVSSGIVGTMFSVQNINAAKGEEIELDLVFDSEGLTPGKYAVDMLAYIDFEFNRQIVFDRVGNAFLFEIIDESPDALIWLSQDWGHIQLKDVEIENI